MIRNVSSSLGFSFPYVFKMLVQSKFIYIKGKWENRQEWCTDVFTCTTCVQNPAYVQDSYSLKEKHCTCLNDCVLYCMCNSVVIGCVDFLTCWFLDKKTSAEEQVINIVYCMTCSVYFEPNPVLWSLGCIQIFGVISKILLCTGVQLELLVYSCLYISFLYLLVLAYKWLATLPISGHLIMIHLSPNFPTCTRVAFLGHSWGGTLAACYVHGMAWNLKSPSISSVRCRSLVECTLLVWCATWVGMN